MAQYYIRQPNAEGPIGPFDVAQLQSLAESGQISVESFYFEEGPQKWVRIGDNPEFTNTLFPKKEKLKLKPKTDSKVDLLNKKSDLDGVISVDKMLAAADGRTEDTQHLKASKRSAARAATVGTYGLGIAMMLSAFALIWPNLGAIGTMINNDTYGLALEHPTLLIGCFDVLMAIFLLLGVTDIYSILRIRIGLGLGYFLYLFWCASDPVGGVAVVMSHVGVLVCTVSRRFSVTLPFAVAAIAGMAGLALLAYTH